MTTSDVVLAAQKISKRYGNVQALDRVDLAVPAGTVHCLVGENGSGKSTLTKIFAGVEQPDSGTLVLGGSPPVPGVSTRTSVDAGIRVIYQDLALFPNLSVAENLLPPSGSGLLRWRRPRAGLDTVHAALDRVGLAVDPSRLVEELSVAERQLVAIARSISSESRIILMDEPTAALTQDEIDRLLELISDLRSTGLAFMFITHKMREIAEVADEVTILRNGLVAASGPAPDFDADRITTLMTGGIVERGRRSPAPAPSTTPVLELRAGSLAGRFTDVDLSVHAGRVVGLAGILGSGRAEIGLALAGLLPLDAGQILVRGVPVRHPRQLRRLQYVPEDRLSEGLLLDWSVGHNIVLNDLPEATNRFGLLRPSLIRAIARRWRATLNIKVDDVDDAVSTLSGGNQQRVLLARALAPEPEAIILSNPTVGVDVGSRAELHELIRSTADRGMAVLAISDEPAELLDICDEIVVVRRGRVAGRWPVTALDEETIWSTITDEDVPTWAN
ncbi:sugar ABC transporter ATP-binding protein [Phytoactinopolyspora limicola]|uniref:sugar ABC transporter ATP-binding protein n=1 Tax=Phytoactinopolyspora limicola TaxID=2715536 RepID=UPI00140DC9B4|nr:sugar ABC transporter ATP-binding protein [Phytoactinopolyspora limicola]